MGDLLKGVHLLTQQEYNELAASNTLDADVLYITPEDIANRVELNTENIEKNRIDIDSNSAEILKLKQTAPPSDTEIVEIRNELNYLNANNETLNNRLSVVENDYAQKTTVVNLTDSQTITGPKTFTEHIYLANVDGTVDRISHLNNNFIIHSGATNAAVLNIDEGLSKIYAFNKELAFKSDLTESTGSTVIVDDVVVNELVFSSDPQTQINTLSNNIDSKLELNLNSSKEYTDDKVSNAMSVKADKTTVDTVVSKLNSIDLDVVDLQKNKANKDLSNVTYPQLTLLWSGYQTSTGTLSLSENISNFRFICVIAFNSYNAEYVPYYIPTTTFAASKYFLINLNNPVDYIYTAIKKNSDTEISVTGISTMGIAEVYGVK